MDGRCANRWAAGTGRMVAPQPSLPTLAPWSGNDQQKHSEFSATLFAAEAAPPSV
jgi:hypothetical protein